MKQKTNFLLLIIALAALAAFTGYMVYRYAVCPVPEQSSQLAVPKVIEITFNNYPDDTVVLLNNGLAQITPTRKNVTIKGITNVVIQKTDGTLIKKFTAQELHGISIVNINKDPATGEYKITKQP